jgi:hypothetical protein
MIAASGQPSRQDCSVGQITVPGLKSFSWVWCNQNKELVLPEARNQTNDPVEHRDVTGQF